MESQIKLMDRLLEAAKEYVTQPPSVKEGVVAAVTLVKGCYAGKSADFESAYDEVQAAVDKCRAHRAPHGLQALATAAAYSAWATHTGKSDFYALAEESAVVAETQTHSLRPA